MLGKLLKYDLQNSVKYYATMAAILVCSIIIAFLCSLTKISVLSTIVFGFSYLLTFLLVGGYFLVCFTRFYTQMCGNESYLTYMVPASIGKTVFSKLLAALLWGIVIIVMLIGFWTALVYITFPNLNLSTQIDNVLETLKPFTSFLMIMVVFLLLVSNLLIALSSAISCLPVVKNRNGGLGILIISFFVLYQLSVIVLVAVSMIMVLLSGGSFTSEFLSNPASSSLIFNSVSNAMLGCTVMYTILFYIISVHLFRKHRRI